MDHLIFVVLYMALFWYTSNNVKKYVNAERYGLAASEALWSILFIVAIGVNLLASMIQ